MDYQEAIDVLTNEIGCVELDTNNRGYIDESEKRFIDACNTAISAMQELQLYKDGKLCLIPESVYSKQCTELDAYKQLGTLEEVGAAMEKQTAISREIIEGKYFCPKCHNLMPYPGYCGCGQKLY